MHHDTAEMNAGAAEMATDPVCGMKVDVGARGPSFEHRGEIYWFCSEGCRTKFAGDPERYLTKQSEAKPLPKGTLYTCPIPLIGRVHGDCYAGGVGLAAVCDVLVAADGMQFCLSEARLGLLPATIGPYVLRALGHQAARRYFISAERFGAAEAHRLGFVHELASTETIDAKVEAIVQALLANGPEAVKASKRLVQDLAAAPITPELRADTARRIADIRASDEGREGVQAFLNKRAPRWLGPQ